MHILPKIKNYSLYKNINLGEVHVWVMSCTPNFNQQH